MSWYIWCHLKKVLILLFSCNWLNRINADFLQVLHSQIYTDVWNRHRESEIHDIHEIGSGTKLYYLWVKGFSTWGERDTQSFYADCFYIVSSQPNWRAAPVAHKFLWPLPALNLDSLSEAGTQPTDFSQIPKIWGPRFRCMTSFTPPGHNSIWGFILTSVNDASTPRTREHLRYSCT